MDDHLHSYTGGETVPIPFFSPQNYSFNTTTVMAKCSLALEKSHHEQNQREKQQMLELLRLLRQELHSRTSYIQKCPEHPSIRLQTQPPYSAANR